MGLTSINKDRTIVITGKEGTGKTTMAKGMFEDAIIYYANDMEISDIRSVPKDRGIIIEDIHYNPKKDEILNVLRNYGGKVVMTSLNQKSVPADIKNMVKFKRAGTKQYLREEIKLLAPRCEEPFSYEKDTFSLVLEYMKDSNRDLIAKMLKVNKPADTQIMSWLVENIHPNRLIFADGIVKRRWSQDYFYEILAYSYQGKNYSRPSYPKRGAYSKIPSLCRRLKLRSGDERLLRQLLKDEEFTHWAKTKLNNGECRILGLGEKKIRKSKPKIKISKLSDYYAMDGKI
tara:strand:+ start:3366 stop:4229 length:864 start_codon:yes stop_codon:yes gene_type:complete